MKIRVVIPVDMFISSNFNVASPKVSFLTDLYDLDDRQMIMDNVNNVPRFYSVDWNTPLLQKFRHIYLEWLKETDFLTRLIIS